jgi:hypothetical protein
VYMCVRRMCVCVYGCVCGVVHILCASMVVCVMCVCVLTAPTLLRPRPPKLCQPPQFVSTLVPRCFPHTPLAPPPPYFLAVYSSEQSRPLFRPAVSASGNRTTACCSTFCQIKTFLSLTSRERKRHSVLDLEDVL